MRTKYEVKTNCLFWYPYRKKCEAHFKRDSFSVLTQVYAHETDFFTLIL
jgi:hypothetical protein